jgi:hypothetical protein
MTAPSCNTARQRWTYGAVFVQAITGPMRASGGRCKRSHRSGALILNRTYVVVPSPILELTCGNVAVPGVASGYVSLTGTGEPSRSNARAWTGVTVVILTMCCPAKLMICRSSVARCSSRSR